MPTQIMNLEGVKSVAKHYTIECNLGFLEKMVFWTTVANTVTHLDAMKEYGYIRFLNQGKKNFPRFLVRKRIVPETPEEEIQDVFFIPMKFKLEIPINHQFGNTEKIKFDIKWTNATFAAYFTLMLVWR